MPRLKHSSRAALETLVPVAVAEGWTVQALAVACHCGKAAAAAALKAHRALIAARLAQSHGETVAEMRRVALCERPAVTRRLHAAGALADMLLARAAVLIESLDVEAGPGGSAEQRLSTLAGVVQKATVASVQSWECFKDASGLELAEKVRASALMAAMKATPERAPSPFEVVVVFPDEE